MWILKNSKELLENLKAQSLHSVNSIKYFDFSTLYTTIPHDKLISKLKEIINQCFFHKNGKCRLQYVVVGYKDTCFVRDYSDAPQKYSDADVIKMLKYLIDNIFVEFGGRIFQQTIGIPMVLSVDHSPYSDRRLRELCTVACRLVFILVWGEVCTKSPQSRQETPCTTIQFHLQIYRWCIVSEKHKICRVFGIRLSTWTWNKGNNGDCSILLILGLLYLLWQRKAYFWALRQMGWLEFSHC